MVANNASQTQVLSRDDLRNLAPSVFATAPWASVSTAYRFVPTIKVLGMMEDQGFHPVMAKQSRTRIEGKAPFTKHMIRLRHSQHLAAALHDEVPEMVLINSHDRCSAYKLMRGDPDIRPHTRRSGLRASPLPFDGHRRGLQGRPATSALPSGQEPSRES
jgi:Domain of unknown function (DUF932)